MKLSCLLIAIAFGFIPLYAAFDYPANSPKNAALSGSPLASTYAGDGFLLNPALLVNANRFYAALNYSQLFNLKELRYSSGMVGMSLKSLGLGVGVEDFGNTLYRETKISIGAAKLFYNNILAVGLAVQIYHVSIERYGSSNSFGLNLGMRYQLLAGLHVAGTIENFNRPKLNGFGEQIPQKIQIGVQYQPLEQLAAHLKVQKDSWFSSEVLIGIEYRMLSNLQLCSGFSTLASIPSFGVMLDVSNIEVSYALQYHFDLGPTHFVGIAFNPKS